MLKRLLVAILAAGSLIVLALPASSAAASATPPANNECVVHVIGQKPSGEMELSARRCYPTHAEAMSAEHVGAWGPRASVRASITSPTFVIGYHCDPFNIAAPCTSVVGSGCTGGWLNTSAAWSNKISSTQNGCPTIRHFDGPNLTGSSESTFVVGNVSNLTTLNNKTESIQYS
jgi:hypothetical protein